ncbi:hypothetical protein NL505_28360, partial [Klebsiella pneumoniae]|nr:hypothetical protein [Klebsiella pneumoniae]
ADTKPASKVKSAAQTLMSLASRAAMQASMLGATFNFGMTTLLTAADSEPQSSAAGARTDKKSGGMGFVLVLMVLFIWALPQIAAA